MKYDWKSEFAVLYIKTHVRPCLGVETEDSTIERLFVAATAENVIIDLQDKGVPLDANFDLFGKDR